MADYKIEIADNFYDDMDTIIERKEEYGTYQSNIDKFKKEVEGVISKLEITPKSGANLSSRVVYETKEKFFLVDNYRHIMIYEIVGNKEVHLYRILPTKSNWQRTLEN